MQSELRQQRVQELQKKACRYEQAVFNWTLRLGRAIEKSMPDGTTASKELSKLLTKMKTPEQSRFYGYLDSMSEEMTKVHGEVWVKSALGVLGMREDDDFDIEIAQIHDALDNWTLNVLMYFRAAGLAMKHKEVHFDPSLRRARLAYVLSVFRSTKDNDVSLKAAKIYSKFRYQPVVLASNRAGRYNMYVDPTVCVSYTKHRRCARPVSMPSFLFGAPTKEAVRESRYIKDYQDFRSQIADDSDKKSRMSFWLSARGLSQRPRKFTYAQQATAWDDMFRAWEKGDFISAARVITTGRFVESSRIHPLATHWKRPIGEREVHAWHKWWKR